MLFVLANLNFFPINALKLESNSFKTDSVQKRQRNFRLLAASSAAVYTGSFVLLDKLWYQNGKNNFHFFNDNNNWQQVDKLGHAFSANQISRYSYFLMKGAGLSSKKAALLSAFSGGLLLSPVEFFDGYSPDYGASYGDLAANFSGSLFFGAQMFIFGEEKMRLKISYSESRFAGKRPNIFGKNLGEKIIKDYNGQTYWISFDSEKILKSERKIFKYCQISIGYGGRNMLFANPSESASYGYEHRRIFFLSFDFALSKLKTKKKWLKTLLEALSVLKIPAPALSFSQGKFRGQWLYF